MTVHLVTHPLVKHKLGLMRKHDISTKDFRDLSNEVARLLTYEATKNLETEKNSSRDGPVRWRSRGSRGRKLPSCPF